MSSQAHPLIQIWDQWFFDREMFVLFNCFRFALLTVSVCTFKLMKRARLYQIEQKTDFESLVCLQAAKRMCCCDLIDELWIYAGTCQTLGSCWSGLQLPSVRLAKATESMKDLGLWKSQLLNLKSHLFILSNALVGWKAYCNSGQDMEKLIY